MSAKLWNQLTGRVPSTWISQIASGTPSGRQLVLPPAIRTHDMLPAEELLANVHELRDRVGAVAHELLELARDEAGRLDFVEADAAREAALREAPDGV